MAGRHSSQAPPSLVIELADAARDFIEAAAEAERTVRVPLPSAPLADTVYRLEVHSPGRAEPLFLLAQPVGPLTPTGYPLALRLARPTSLPPPSYEDDAYVPADDEQETPLEQPAPVRPSTQPEWLEPGGYFTSMMPSMPPSIVVPALTANSILPATSMAPPRTSMAPSPTSMAPPRNAMAPPRTTIAPPRTTMAPAPAPDVHSTTAAVLQRLEETRNPRDFDVLVTRMEPQVRSVVQQGHAETAWRLRCTLDAIVAAESTGVGETRAPFAARLLRVFADPTIIATLAEQALNGLDGVGESDGPASNVILRAGRGGAYALYTARLKNGAPEARQRFVSLLQRIGPSALPVICAALLKLESKASTPVAFSITEDLLAGIPDYADDATADVVVRYAREQAPRLAALATMSLPSLLGERATPLLQSLLIHPDEEVAVAAIVGLHRLRAIDRAVVAKLEPRVVGAVFAPIGVRVAALRAFSAPTSDAVIAARMACSRVLTTLPESTLEIEDLVVVAAAALIHAGGNPAFVAERARKSGPSLRARLESVLASAPRT